MNNEKTIHVAARFPESLVARVDAFLQEKAEPGKTITRSDAVRMLVTRGLDAAGRCCAVKGDCVCDQQAGHKRGTHYDSHKDKSWKV
jgi:hypothetical protein